MISTNRKFTKKNTMHESMKTTTKTCRISVPGTLNNPNISQQERNK